MTQSIWLKVRITLSHTDVNRILSIIYGPLEAKWICIVWGSDLLPGRWFFIDSSLGRLAECLVIKAVWRSCVNCFKQQQCLQGATMAWQVLCAVWTFLGHYIWRTFIEAAFTYRQEIAAPVSPANNTNPIRIIPGFSFTHHHPSYCLAQKCDTSEDSQGIF